MEKKLKFFKERTLWIVVTAFLAAVIVLLSFAPLVLAGNQEAETQRLLSTFFEVFRFVQEHYVDEDKVAPNNLIEGAMRGMFEALDDPHSAYLSPDNRHQVMIRPGG